VDETPTPMEAHNDYLRYSSDFKVEGSVLHYQRQYEVDKVMVPVIAFPRCRSSTVPSPLTNVPAWC